MDKVIKHLSRDVCFVGCADSPVAQKIESKLIKKPYQIQNWEDLEKYQTKPDLVIVSNPTPHLLAQVALGLENDAEAAFLAYCIRNGVAVFATYDTVCPDCRKEVFAEKPAKAYEDLWRQYITTWQSYGIDWYYEKELFDVVIKKLYFSQNKKTHGESHGLQRLSFINAESIKTWPQDQPLVLDDQTIVTPEAKDLIRERALLVENHAIKEVSGDDVL